MDILALITTALTNKLSTLFGNLTEEFGEEVKQVIKNNILEYQVEEYNRNSCAKTLLHRVQPKHLKEFYQPLFIIPYKNRQRKKHKRIPTDSISDLFKNKQYITLIGNAGSGKSTIVKYLFLNAIDSGFKIPIKVELRYLNDYPNNITTYIKEKIFKLSKLAFHDRIIERLMNSGDFIFFLDGYDEIITSKKEKVTKELDDLVKIYNKNLYLLTSRPYTEIDLLPLFHNYEVCELSDEEINQFIRKQIPSNEEELCNKIIEAVNNPENTSYKSFLSNPLLLSMFILTFQSYSNIPQKRSEFYSQVFDTLYSTHDSMSKLAFVREKQCGLSKEQIIEVLKLFSFLSYFEEKFIFDGLYLEDKLRLIKSKKKDIVFENNKFIIDLQVGICILNKEGTDFTFPHRSLQEYFAAIYIASLDENNKKIIYKKIMENLTDDKSFRHTFRDNFHLLLSELDEKNVIRHALIPFFESYINILSNDTTNYEEIISRFVILDQVFGAFCYILKDNDTTQMMNYFNEQFRKYHKKAPTKDETEEERMKTLRSARRLVAENDIKPFLNNYIQTLEQKKEKLEKYLRQKNNTDFEIISLI